MAEGENVTEAEWLASIDPQKMLEFLQGKASARKFRYFLVACARRVLPSAADEDMVEALAVAERFADGTESRYRLAWVRSSLKIGHPARVGDWFPLYSTHIRSLPAWHAAREQIVRAAREGANCCAWSSTLRGGPGGSIAMTLPTQEWAAQASLLRCIFGTPFRPTTLAPAVLTWNDATVVRLAQAAYDDRHLPSGTLDKARLLVLADALNEAACSDVRIVEHLRGPSEHVRGCWVLDLLLGKE